MVLFDELVYIALAACKLDIRKTTRTLDKIVEILLFKQKQPLHIHYTVGSRSAAVSFTTIHFYDPCRVGPSTPDLWCITVAIQASFLYLIRF